ncbi:MAG TPA: arylsulfotransferase family protein, partial [Opitutaceae bacterium]
MAPGYIFIGAEPSAAAANPVQGPEILDEQGRIVWFSLLPAGQVATDFRVQTYEGNPVLTWAQSSSFGAGNPVTMNGYILDNTYTVVASVQASGFNGDQHEFQLTPQNTALLVIYAARQADLSSIGGPSDGYVTEGVVQEIDIATGALLFEWHSLDHVPPSESHAPVPASAPITAPYDYFHINSAKLDTDGNLLISSRHTWTVYKVNRTTGDVIWRLGGKSSSFAMGPGAAFAWQHDAEAVDSSTIRIFDNESNGAAVLPYTRVIFLHHDDTAMTATLSESITHPDQLSVLAEGSAQSLDNGDTFVEWGFLGRYSEFGPTGQLLYDVAEAPGYSSYRGYHQVWSGAPSGSPTGIALTNDDGSLLVHAIWNGATQVATWEVLGGATAGTLSTIASAPWNGFNTTVKAPGGADVVQVVALDSSGNVIGTSAPATGPFPYVFRTQPESQAIAPGGTIVFRAAAAGPVPAYQWMFNGGPLADGSANGASVSGAATSTLMIRGATPADAGSYTCVASRLGNTATTDPAILTVATTTDMGRLTNISCRSAVGPGFGNLILGFAITGQDASAPESLLVRASGPA